MTTSPRRVFIKTYGCQMNVYDSERMAETLAPQGYVRTDTAEDADLVLLNTCHIREKAAEKVYSDLGRLKPLKEAIRLAESTDAMREALHAWITPERDSEPRVEQPVDPHFA